MQHCGDHTPCQAGEVVSVGFTYLAQQPMQAQPFQKPGNATPAPGVQDLTQSARRQADQRMFSAEHDLEYPFVLLKKGLKPR